MRVRSAVERTTERTVKVAQHPPHPTTPHHHHPPGNTAFVMWTLHVVPVSERGCLQGLPPKVHGQKFGVRGDGSCPPPPSSRCTEASDGFLILNNRK